MAGFLRGWLRGESLERCCTFANACGALVVSRHGCAPAMASWEELELFLSRSDWPHRLRNSEALEQIHWSTNRHPREIADLTVLAIDHRSQLSDLAARLGIADLSRIERYKGFALDAIRALAADDSGFGVLADDTFGARVLEAAADLPYWIGRPIELPGSCPVAFEGGADVAITLRDWPLNHVVKCLVFYHPDDTPELRDRQDRQLRRLFDACRATRHEFLLEIIASKGGPVGDDTVSRVIDHVYGLGVYPDWWKLETQPVTAGLGQYRGGDPAPRSALPRRPAARLSAPREELFAGLRCCSGVPIVKGFAVGRTIWQESAREVADGRD
jgi:5-dehydro-2-deoxygluconokinase